MHSIIVHLLHPAIFDCGVFLDRLNAVVTSTFRLVSFRAEDGISVGIIVSEVVLTVFFERMVTRFAFVLFAVEVVVDAGCRCCRVGRQKISRLVKILMAWASDSNFGKTEVTRRSFLKFRSKTRRVLMPEL